MDLGGLLPAELPPVVKTIVVVLVVFHAAAILVYVMSLGKEVTAPQRRFAKTE